MPRVMSQALNDKEKRVLAAFPTEKDDKGHYQYVTLSDLAGKSFAKRGVSPKTKGNSWVRNSLRKLLALKLVFMKGARTGQYRLTGNQPPEPKTAEEEAATKAKAKTKTKGKSKIKTKSKSKFKIKTKPKTDEAVADSSSTDSTVVTEVEAGSEAGAEVEIDELDSLSGN